MTKQEAIKRMFDKDLAFIWTEVFDTKLNCIDPFALDAIIEKYHGKHEGSLKNYIINNFGKDVFEALL